MPISQQMQSIVDTIATFKAGLEAKLVEQADEPHEIIEPLDFCTILSGVPSFRRLPGVPEHMGFDPDYVCDTPEHAQELRDYLDSVLGIKDLETLLVQKQEFFHTFNEYYDFACDWDGTPNFQLEDLNEEGRANYLASRDFAVYLRDLVQHRGFLAWDIGERIMLARAAYACGIITKEQFEDVILTEGRICNEVFDNFAQFAVSVLAGSVYYMFTNMGRVEEEGLSGFLDINMHIVSKLFQDDIWSVNAWCEKNYKQLAIQTDQIQQILPDNYIGLTAIASDRILCEGYRIAVMLRETPGSGSDTGWRFFAGDEEPEYLANPNNFGALDINLIANYSPDILPFLEMPVGTLLGRDDDGVFQPVDPNAPDEGDPIAYG